MHSAISDYSGCLLSLQASSKKGPYLSQSSTTFTSPTARRPPVSHNRKLLRSTQLLFLSILLKSKSPCSLPASLTSPQLPPPPLLPPPCNVLLTGECIPYTTRNCSFCWTVQVKQRLKRTSPSVNSPPSNTAHSSCMASGGSSRPSHWSTAAFLSVGMQLFRSS